MNTTTATAEQVKAVNQLIEAGIEYLDDDVSTPEELVAYLNNVIVDIDPQGDWTDDVYRAILGQTAKETTK